MMNNTKENISATTADMQNAIKQLLKENLVGFTMEEKGALRFVLPGGQAFLITVKNDE